MKIIHLTDTHILGAERANIYGIDVALHLKKALKSIEKYHSDTEFITITGDLVDIPTREAYAMLSKLISKSSIPIYPIVGNHDSREYFKEFFPNLLNAGFAQYFHQSKKKNFIFLDTLIEGERYGAMCQERLDWLEEQLLANNELPTYLFMHHHPIDSGLYEMDNVADFRSKEKFWNIVQKYPNIQHICFGHVHRIMHGYKGSVSMHATRSTTFQVSYQPGTKLEYLTNQEKPTYAVIEILSDDSARINHHEYLDERMYYEDGERFI